MSNFFRRLRGILGMGLAWSLVWAVAGAAIGALESFVLGRAPPQLGPRIVVASSFSWATYGFVLGTLFTSVLAIAERRRTLDQLATWRLAIWGCLAGTVLPIAFIIGARTIAGLTINNGFSTTILSAVLGAGCAAGSLTVARAGLPESRRSGQSIRDSLPGPR